MSKSVAVWWWSDGRPTFIEFGQQNSSSVPKQSFHVFFLLTNVRLNLLVGSVTNNPSLRPCSETYGCQWAHCVSIVHNTVDKLHGYSITKNWSSNWWEVDSQFRDRECAPLTNHLNNITNNVFWCYRLPPLMRAIMNIMTALIVLLQTFSTLAQSRYSLKLLP